MRKFAVLVVLFALVLGALPISVAAAAPVEDLTALARYFPADTVFFAAARTDPAFLETLDALLQRVSATMPDVEAASLPDILDQFAGQVTQGEGDWESVFGSWLGGTAAIALPSLDRLTDDDMGGLGPAVFAFDVADPQAFTDQLMGILTRFEVQYEQTEGDGYTLWAFENDDPGALFMLRDDALFLARYEDLLPTAPVAESLADSAQFTGVRDRLPADEYNAAVYLDTAAFMRFSMEMNAAMMPNSAQEMMPDMSAFINALGAQMWGFTILDGTALVLDAAVQTDPALYEDMGIPMADMTAQLEPANLAFAARIPADAPLAIISSNLGPSAQAALDAYPAMIEAMMAQMPDMPEGQAPAQDMENVLNFLRLTFTGLTGQNLEDVLAWMDGDFALYLRLVETENIPGMPLFPDLALVAETSDPAASQALLEGLANGLDEYNTTYTQEAIGGGTALVLPDLLPGLLQDLPRAARRAEGLNFIIGTAGDVFALGTREAVSFSLAPSGDSLATDPAAQAAQAYLLPGTVQVWYANVGALADLIEQYAPRADREGVAALRLFSTATISTTATEDGAGLARFVLSLAE